MSNWLLSFGWKIPALLKHFAILYICIKSWKVSERISWLAEKKTATWRKQWHKSFVTLEKTVNSTMFTKGKPEGKGGEATGAHRVQVCTLSAATRNKNCWSFKVTFWSSFSSVVVWLCAAYANIVLPLCSLSRQSHADLVEPLIAAAVTLDPVYLTSKKRRNKHQSIDIGIAKSLQVDTSPPVV